MSRSKRGGRQFELDGLISVDQLIDVGVTKRDIQKLKEAGVYDCNYLKSFDPKGSALSKFFTTGEVLWISEASDVLMNKLAAERLVIDEGSSDELTDGSGSNAGKSRKRVKSMKQVDGSEDGSDVSEDDFLHVSGLPSNVSQSQMDDFFEGCGAFKKCSVIRYDDGQCKGYAFVKFKSPAATADALRRNGRHIDSNRISVVIGKKGMRRVGGSRKRAASGGEMMGPAKNKRY